MRYRSQVFHSDTGNPLGFGSPETFQAAPVRFGISGGRRADYSENKAGLCGRRFQGFEENVQTLAVLYAADEKEVIHRLGIPVDGLLPKLQGIGGIFHGS